MHHKYGGGGAFLTQAAIKKKKQLGMKPKISDVKVSTWKCTQSSDWKLLQGCSIFNTLCVCSQSENHHQEQKNGRPFGYRGVEK